MLKGEESSVLKVTRLISNFWRMVQHNTDLLIDNEDTQ